ncbi:hypothetical protein BDZ97DRAFT_1753486 [Flammula alnicola]|nr:hypothetical protein BDZ97DRAFT_1753486 [Flammula alnicola]
MPTLSTTIEDTSPVIIYSGNGGGDWTAGTSRQDPFADQYSQSSFMVTQVDRADVSFTFYGTGVQLYGAKRPNHGPYQISIDSFVYPQVNGSDPDDPGTFQTALFSTVALNNGYHTVRMTNLGTAFLDIDFITWQTPVGLANESLMAMTVQDSDPSFKYMPASVWNANPSNLGMFSGGSGHVTSTAGAWVEYTFEGGPFSVVNLFLSANLCGQAIRLLCSVLGTPANYSANKQFYRPQMVLYQASDLGGGQHTIKLESQAWNNSGLTFAIDYAQVFTTASLQHMKSGLSAGAIVGISIGAIVALIALIVSFFVFRHRKPLTYRKIFRLKGKSETSARAAETFEYRPIESISSHGAPSSSHGLLRSQVSHSSLQATPPSTGLWPSSGGTYGGTYASSTADLLPGERYGPNTQVITIPFTPDGKYRPDIIPAPQLMPPPQGARRTPSFGQNQTLHAVMDGGLSGAGANRESRVEDRRPSQPAAVLAPVRRPVNVVRDTTPPPPEYRRDPLWL